MQRVVQPKLLAAEGSTSQAIFTRRQPFVSVPTGVRDYVNQFTRAIGKMPDDRSLFPGCGPDIHGGTPRCSNFRRLEQMRNILLAAVPRTHRDPLAR